MSDLGSVSSGVLHVFVLTSRVGQWVEFCVFSLAYYYYYYLFFYFLNFSYSQV